MTEDEFERALAEAEAGSGVTQGSLGARLLYGLGVPRDFGLAKHLLERGHAQGVVVATASLGVLHWKGWGVHRDMERAMGLLDQAAAKGHLPALMDLARIHRDGDGVDADAERAASYYRRALEQADDDDCSKDVREARDFVGLPPFPGRGAPTITFATSVAELTQDDVLRAIEDGPDLLLVIANAYDGMFSRCFAEGSRAFLDHLTGAWQASEEDPWMRLTTSLRSAAHRFMVDFAPGPTTTELDIAPGLTVLVVHLTPRHATCAWVGAHQARLAREGTLLAQTPREDLAALYGSSDPTIPNIVVRTIAIDSPHREPNVLQWSLRPGDQVTLVACDASPFVATITWLEPDPPPAP